MTTNKLPYETVTVTKDGVTMVVPTELPSNARADQLVALYCEHVKPTKAGGHWKDACHAIVTADIADDVAEAMNHMGSIVDHRQGLIDGMVRIWSAGYYAHGF